MVIVLALTIPTMYGFGRHGALGLTVVSVGSLLLYRFLRGDVVVLWLRPFHDPRLRATNFGTLLWSACALLATPVTVQDSTFKFDRAAALMKSGFVPAACISLIGYGMLANDQAHDWLRDRVGPSVTFVVLVSLVIGALCYRRIGYLAVTPEEAKEYTRRFLARIEGRRGWFAPGVVTIRCTDSCWRDAVEACLERAAVAVIDVTKLTENIIWELQAALRLLPPQCVILAYAVESNENEEATVSIMRELRMGLGMELPADVQMFPYPAVAGSMGAWGQTRSITAALAQLIGSGLAQSPRAERLRAAIMPRDRR